MMHSLLEYTGHILGKHAIHVAVLIIDDSVQMSSINVVALGDLSSSIH